MARELIRDYTSGNVTKQLIRFAAPLFFANILQVVYTMADMVIAGRIIGNAGLSAVSIGGDISDFITTVVIGFANAAQVIISQYIGARKRDNIGKFIGTFVSVLFIAAVTISAASLIFRRRILALMNTPAEVFEYALAYTTTIMAGLVFIYGYNAVSSILRGLGDSRHPFFFIAIASVMNIVLDILFMAVFRMGIFGAAFATVLSQAFSFLCSLIFLTRNRHLLGFEIGLKDFRIRKDMLSDLVKLGIPMALMSAAIRISILFTNSFVNSYGTVVSAVTGVGGRINNMSNMLSNATRTAGTAMIGQNIGAEKYDRVPKIMLSIWAVTGVVTSVFIALIIIFPQQIFSLFTSEPDKLMTVAMQHVPPICLFLAAGIMRSGAISLIFGSGNYKMNYLITILDAFALRIGLGLLLGLGLGMGYQGFWWGNALSATTPFYVGIIYLISGKWRTNKYIIHDE